MATTYQVAEDAGVMQVCFHVQSTASCVIPFPISITVSTRTDSGTQCLYVVYLYSMLAMIVHPSSSAGSDDYTFESSETSLSPCQPRKCVEIAITDDTLVEGDEKFRVSLSNLRSPEGDRRITRVRINPSQAQVTINDDDCELVTFVSSINLITN